MITAEFLTAYAVFGLLFAIAFVVADVGRIDHLAALELVMEDAAWEAPDWWASSCGGMGLIKPVLVRFGN